MAYDAAKADDSLYTAHELLTEAQANDVLLYAVPQYRLQFSHDRYYRTATVRWQRGRAPGDPWVTLDEASVATHGVWGVSSDKDAELLAVAQLRANKRYRAAALRAS